MFLPPASQHLGPRLHRHEEGDAPGEEEVQHLERIVLPVEEERLDLQPQLLGVPEMEVEHPDHVTPTPNLAEGDREPPRKSGEVEGGIAVEAIGPLLGLGSQDVLGPVGVAPVGNEVAVGSEDDLALGETRTDLAAKGVGEETLEFSGVNGGQHPSHLPVGSTALPGGPGEVQEPTGCGGFEEVADGVPDRLLGKLLCESGEEQGDNFSLDTPAEMDGGEGWSGGFFGPLQLERWTLKGPGCFLPRSRMADTAAGEHSNRTLAVFPSSNPALQWKTSVRHTGGSVQILTPVDDQLLRLLVHLGSGGPGPNWKGASPVTVQSVERTAGG